MKRGIIAATLLLAGCADDPIAPPVIQATPTPRPTATPFFDSSTACGAPVLGRDDARTARCDAPNRAIGGEFSRAVEDAMFWVSANRRDMFFDGTVRVKDTADFTQAVADRIARATGLCASIDEDDGERIDDIIRVKQGNGAGASGEWYDIVLSDNSLWGPPPLMVRRCRLGPGW